jgi:phosphoribosylanthranilate isomerase
VKICGLTREEDVALAVEAGADAMGFIVGFQESPRNISLSRAGELMRKVPPFVDTVLVTKAGLVERSLDMIIKVHPAMLQVYGVLPDPEQLKDVLGVKLILPYLMKEGGNGLAETRGFDAVLSDTYRRGHFGGTGKTSDWGSCRNLRDRIAPVPFILSGGLNPQNVEEAVTRVRPFAVDVSSGVEAAPGVKDPTKVRAFVRKATGGA